MVRNGYMREREIQTGIGGVPVKVPRVRDRSGELQFRSKVAPPYLRRAKSVEELLPWLYLRGISTGDFSDALEALVGRDAPGLSAPTISRLKRGLGQGVHGPGAPGISPSKRYVYVWADGIHAKARLDDAKLCLLVLIGATEDGTKELIAVEDGYRESEASWLELLAQPRSQRVSSSSPSWRSVTVLWASGRPWPRSGATPLTQRCWVHKTGNVLNKLPKASSPRPSRGCTRSGWPRRARMPSEPSTPSSRLRGPSTRRRRSCLAKDREALLTFYDFPSRALGPSQDYEPDRIHVCHRAAANGQDPRLSEPRDHALDGLQAMPERGETVAPAAGLQAHRRGRQRSPFRRWRTPRTDRRLSCPYTTFEYCSCPTSAARCEL